jgi:hypothetical protein
MLLGEMGIGVRSFLVDDAGQVSRIPWSRMTRLFRGLPTQEFHELRGSPVRCAVVFLEYENRRPARILRTEFSVLYIDDNGSLDSEAQSQQLRLIGQCLDDTLAVGGERGNVVDIRPHLARKQYRERFEWTPTEDVLEAIFRRCQ